MKHLCHYDHSIMKIHINNIHLFTQKMIIVAGMFHKLTPRNRQTSETFIQVVFFFVALFQLTSLSNSSS